MIGTVAYHKANNAAGFATKLLFVGGIYDFQVAKLHAAWGKTTTDLNTLETKEWMIGTTVPFGAANFIASYTQVKNDLVANANKGKQYAIGGTYALSKRTNFYTNYARTTNDANSNAGGIAATNGATDRLVNFGIRHKF